MHAAAVGAAAACLPALTCQHPPVATPLLPPQVVASSLDTLDSVLLSGFHSREDLVACLKASANVPELAGGPLEHRRAGLRGGGGGAEAPRWQRAGCRAQASCTYAAVLCCRGHRLVDAAVFEAIPYRSAIGDGCTHVLVLNNLPRVRGAVGVGVWQCCRVCARTRGLSRHRRRRRSAPTSLPITAAALDHRSRRATRPAGGWRGRWRMRSRRW